MRARSFFRTGRATGCAALLLAAASGALAQTPEVPVRPQGSPPAWAPDITPEMLAVVEQLDSFGVPPLQLLTPFQARMAKTPADAVRALVERNGMPPVEPRVRIRHIDVPGPAGESILVRTYTPTAGDGPFPVIVYYHGGGWVIADLNTYEASARALAEQAGAIVLSVAYRQGPENRFPAAHDDALAAYRWATQEAQNLNGDPDRIALAGESAGGNLAVATALQARDRGLPAPVHILAVYPIADGDTASASYDRFAQAQPLNRPMMVWFFRNYLRTSADARDPRISLVNADLSGLAPTTIVNAGIDPLLSDGEELAQRMRAAGVQVEQRTFPGVTHEFFGMGVVIDQAREAQRMAVQRLRTSFAAQ